MWASAGHHHGVLLASVGVSSITCGVDLRLIVVILSDLVLLGLFKSLDWSDLSGVDDTTGLHVQSTRNCNIWHGRHRCGLFATSLSLTLRMAQGFGLRYGFYLILFFRLVRKRSSGNYIAEMLGFNHLRHVWGCRVHVRRDRNLGRINRNSQVLGRLIWCICGWLLWNLVVWIHIPDRRSLIHVSRF